MRLIEQRHYKRVGSLDTQPQAGVRDEEGAHPTNDNTAHNVQEIMSLHEESAGSYTQEPSVHHSFHQEVQVVL